MTHPANTLQARRTRIDPHHLHPEPDRRRSPMTRSTPSSSRALITTLLGLGACAAPQELPPPDNSWDDGVSGRIRDASHAPVADGDAFSSEVPEQGITARFDGAGVSLQQEQDAISVRAVGWGREAAMDRMEPTSPTLGACVDGWGHSGGSCVQRVEYPGAGVTEWWASGADGFEQGWTVDQRRAGDGPLVIVVGIEGAIATVGLDDVWLDGEEGAEWIVSGLVAWDAEGAALDARFDRDAEGFRVTVDDEDATYPIEIDPVYATATTTLTGAATNGVYGYSVADAGDVNGDGYADVIVGSPNYDSYTGRAYVYLGGAAGVSTTASTELSGASIDNYFGTSVSGAGDVDGDGYDDVIVGADRYSISTGRAYVYLGSATGVSTTASTTLAGASIYNRFGNCVSSAGDVNGDGYDDVIVGAWGYGSYTGRAHVFLGSASGISSTASTTMTGESSSNYFGYSVSSAGDVNGDGYDDVVVGANGYATYTGRSYVYLGSATGIPTTASATLTGEASGTNFGISVSDAGDVTGDGYDDVIIGSSGYSTSTGRAYLYVGAASGVSTTASTTLTGETTSTNFGFSVSGVGDVTGDGYDDVIVGAPGYGSSTGRAYVYPGSDTGLSTTATTLDGEASGNAFARSLSGAGDVNGDGYEDVIVGAYGYSSYIGRAYVHHGYADADPDADGDGYASSEDCDDADDTVFPGAVERPYDGIDQDCDGADLTDVDRDGVDSTRVGGTDCNDRNRRVYPGAPDRRVDGIDQNCNGVDGS